MADVFISYKREDRPEVEQIAAALRKLKVTVWFDESLKAGEQYSDQIHQQLGDARAILVCWSQAAVGSSWVKAEALRGFPERLAACIVSNQTLLDVPTPFHSVHAAELVQWADLVQRDPTEAGRHKGWQQVVKALGALLDRPGLAAYACIPPKGASGRIEELDRWHEDYPDDPLSDAAWQEVHEAELGKAQANLAARKAEITKRALAQKDAPLAGLVAPPPRTGPAATVRAAAKKDGRGTPQESRGSRTAMVIIGIVVGTLMGTGAAYGFWRYYDSRDVRPPPAVVEAHKAEAAVPVTPAKTIAPIIGAEGKSASIGAFAAAEQATSTIDQRLFRDCEACPEMVAIPSGSFRMGSDRDPRADDKPAHVVEFVPAFAAGRYEVTWEEFQRCVDDQSAACVSPVSDASPGGRYPVTNVSWEDA